MPEIARKFGFMTKQCMFRAHVLLKPFKYYTPSCLEYLGRDKYGLLWYHNDIFEIDKKIMLRYIFSSLICSTLCVTLVHGKLNTLYERVVEVVAGNYARVDGTILPGIDRGSDSYVDNVRCPLDGR